MATMTDVAREAGVSRYTVSKVFNGIHVTEKTREKVMAACEKLQYHRNLFAVNLVNQQTHLIGMVISQAFDSFFGPIISAAEKEAHQHGYHLLCQCSYEDPEEERRIIETLLSMQVCAICTAPVTRDANRDTWKRVEERMPVIYFDRHLKAASNYIITDNFKSAQMVTEHLLAQGRRPAYFGSVHPESNLAIQQRNKGYAVTMRVAGHEPILIPATHSSETQDTPTYGYENMLAYIAHNDPPEALFCATDRIALGAMHALREKGLKPGQDVLVAGHDDLSFCGFVNPTLTSVTQPKSCIGQESVRAVMQLLEKPSKRIRKVLQPELIVRESTSPV